MLLRDVPFSIIFWLGYEELKRRFLQGFAPDLHPLVPFVSGSISGTVAAIVTTPLDVVKTHMQVELGEYNPSAMRLGIGSITGVMRNIVDQHGSMGLFAGLTPRIAKVAPACAIMIGSYEACKKFFAERNLLTQN
jgi:solute carrier family 25 protein 39/40